MRTIYRAENIIDANLLKGLLEEHGIPAYVSGGYLTGAIGKLPARDLVTVMVPDEAVEAAAPIVREIEAALSEARAVSNGGWLGADPA